MENVEERIYQCGIVPVVVLAKTDDAIATAKALLGGGIDVMEITLRTSAGLDSIRLVARELPEMLVGAGTVLTVEEAKACIEAGANFIVSPGFDEEMVNYCVQAGVLVIPGCVTPSEIIKALKYGLKVLKFFPANVYGGLAGLKALGGPFPNVKFIPTGGVDACNLVEFITAPNVFAVGGSWVCSKNDISNKDFESITRLSAESRKALLGFELAHVGLNCDNTEEAIASAEAMRAMFGFPVKEGSSSCFAGTGFEFMKTPFLGKHGHLAIRTNDINRGMAYMKNQGFEFDEANINSLNGKVVAAYFKDQVAGFAVHLLQK